MKKRILILFFAALILLSGCVHTTVSPTTQPPAENVTQPVTEPATAEPETEPPAEIDRRAEEIYNNHPELTPVDYDSPALLPISDDMGQAYIDNITFLCDSPMYWLKLYGLLKDGSDTAQVWTGPEGTMTLAYLRGFEILDPVDNVLRTIPAAVAAHKPPFILITVGINGVSFMDEAYFTREYKNLIDEIQQSSPDTVIVLQSICPSSPAYRYWGDITNVTITRANSWILQLAEENGLKYLDSFSCLVGEDGNIRSDLVMKDGLHANEAGLTLVLEYIRTHAYQPE
jgi:hypothetical protein